MRWAVLVVPLVLILIALSTRYITHLPVMDILSDPTMSWSQMEDNLSDWHLHKRHPAEADAQPSEYIRYPFPENPTYDDPHFSRPHCQPWIVDNHRQASESADCTIDAA